LRFSVIFSDFYAVIAPISKENGMFKKKYDILYFFF